MTALRVDTQTQWGLRMPDGDMELENVRQEIAYGKKATFDALAGNGQGEYEGSEVLYRIVATSSWQPEPFVQEYVKTYHAVREAALTHGDTDIEVAAIALYGCLWDTSVEQWSDAVPALREQFCAAARSALSVLHSPPTERRTA